MAETSQQEEKAEQAPAKDTHIMNTGEKSARETYHEEWLNPMNWGGPGNMGVYFSKRDKRIWVPKPKPGMGWTVNLAHTGGILWLAGICMGMILLLAVIAIWMFSDMIVGVLS